jgi:hypothetical protein
VNVGQTPFSSASQPARRPLLETRVPPDLRGYFSCKEFYRSLTTANKREAYRLVRQLSARIELTFPLLRQYMPKNDEGLRLHLITEISLDELGCPHFRVRREAHDTLDDYNAAMGEAVKALGQLPLPVRAKPDVPATSGLSELVNRYIDEQRRGGLRKESVQDYEGDLGQFVKIIGAYPSPGFLTR